MSHPLPVQKRTGEKYISIPIPIPSERRKPIWRRLRLRFSRLKRGEIPRKKSIAKPCEARKNSWEKLDLFQALLVALVVNIAIVVVLALINQTRSKPVRLIQITAISPPEKEVPDQPKSRSSQQSADSPPRAASIDIVNIQQFSQFALPAMELDSLSDDFSIGMFDRGRGQGVKSVSLGMGTIGDAFDRAGISDGREILLFIDTSGSMKKHSEKTAQLVQKGFPKAMVVRVKGCSIERHRGFVSLLEKDKTRRPKIFFVCDLQDKVSPEGLKKLRLHLHDPVTRQLHIISYGEKGDFGLLSVVELSGGFISQISK